MSATVESKYADPPPMKELNVSNHLLGDRQALTAAWERDGYWFFRDVLDKDVIARIRGVYMDYLAKEGAVDRNDSEAIFRGEGDMQYLNTLPDESPLNKAKVHRILHDAPTINAFFSGLFGCDPLWVPFTVHRTTPPAPHKEGSRFDLIHADGFYNDGLDFLICWVPLATIDENIGGIAVVEGVHRKPSLHRRKGMKVVPIQEEDVPAGTWRRATYHPGDVLLMDLDTPHSGLVNKSDRFRLSMDTRITPSNNPQRPIVGDLVAINDGSITVRDAFGDHALRTDENSFVRGYTGNQMPVSDIPSRFNIGDVVIIATDGERVANMRPQA